MLKYIYLSFIALVFGTSMVAQVPKKVVVEHFTNTLCSVCASRNPGFYTNLENNPEVMHLAIHPSAPYKNCVLNKHNTSENDSRTHFYGVYGSTPRLVINGEEISASANYNSSAIFDPFKGQSSPVSLVIDQKKYGSDSIRVNITIKAEEANTLDSLLFFVALVEDTIFYNAPNGENIHYDVFRKSLTGAEGVMISIPAVSGDSAVFHASSAMDVAWDPSRVYAFAMLQDKADKKMVQAGRALASEGVVTSIGGHKCNTEPAIFPNPSTGIINIRHSAIQGVYALRMMDLQGKVVYDETGFGQGSLLTKVDVTSLRPGLYIMEIVCNDMLSTHKVIIR